MGDSGPPPPGRGAGPVSAGLRRTGVHRRCAEKLMRGQICNELNFENAEASGAQTSKGDQRQNLRDYNHCLYFGAYVFLHTYFLLSSYKTVDSQITLCGV